MVGQHDAELASARLCSWLAAFLAIDLWLLTASLPLLLPLLLLLVVCVLATLSCGGWWVARAL